MKNQLCGGCGTCRREYKVLVGKPEGKGLLGIRMSRCDHNITMELSIWDKRAFTGLMWLRMQASGVFVLAR
jgi:hypothetical protein